MTEKSQAPEGAEAPKAGGPVMLAVAWRYVPSAVWHDYVLTSDPKQAEDARAAGIEVEPLYAHPAQSPAEGDDEPREPAPLNDLPSWSECDLIISNHEFRQRAAAGLEGQVRDLPPVTPPPTALHRFIHEYDDSDAYRSDWFMHRLELVVKEAQANVQPKGMPLDVESIRAVVVKLERQAHRMGELWERCQGKGWPEPDGSEFGRLRDESMPATKRDLMSAIVGAVVQASAPAQTVPCARCDTPGACREHEPGKFCPPPVQAPAVAHADLRAPAVLPESMSRDEMLKYYSEYANVQSNEALRYQRRISDQSEVMRKALDALEQMAMACSSCQEGPEGEFCCRKKQWDAVMAIRAALGISDVPVQRMGDGNA